MLCDFRHALFHHGMYLPTLTLEQRVLYALHNNVIVQHV